MLREELERHAAAMRARNAATAKPAASAASAKTTKASPSRSVAVLIVPDLPSVSPYAMLSGVWKSAHTKLLLAALGTVDPLVLRAARSIGTQQVSFDGLIHLNGKGTLDLAASSRCLPEALRLYNILLQTVAARGGQVTATNGTAVTLRGETINIRLREASERRPKQGEAATFRDNEYVPTEMLSFSVDHQQGSDLKTLVRDATDVERFLDKLSRFV